MKWDRSRQQQLFGALETDPLNAELLPPEKALLEYSIKLTRSPGDMDSSDIEKLRQQGFDDRAIHDICCITSYYAFVNRIADGLGVELEQDQMKSPGNND